MEPLCSARKDDSRDGVPVTYPCPRIQCFRRVGKSIYPWVAIPCVTEPSLPVHRVPFFMSKTIDLPLSRGRIMWPRALVYGNGRMSRVARMLCGEGVDVKENSGLGDDGVYWW